MDMLFFFRYLSKDTGETGYLGEGRNREESEGVRLQPEGDSGKKRRI